MSCYKTTTPFSSSPLPLPSSLPLLPPSSDDEDDILAYSTHASLEQQSLLKSLHYTVGKIILEQEQLQQEENDISGIISTNTIKMNQESIACLTQLTFSYITKCVGPDLISFSQHAKRKSITVEDVKLVGRKREGLMEILNDFIDDNQNKNKLSGAAVSAAGENGGHGLDSSDEDSDDLECLSPTPKIKATTHQHQQSRKRMYSKLSIQNHESHDDDEDDQDSIDFIHKKLPIKRPMIKLNNIDSSSSNSSTGIDSDNDSDLDLKSRYERNKRKFAAAIETKISTTITETTTATSQSSVNSRGSKGMSSSTKDNDTTKGMSSSTKDNDTTRSAITLSKISGDGKVASTSTTDDSMKNSKENDEKQHQQNQHRQEKRKRLETACDGLVDSSSEDNEFDYESSEKGIQPQAKSRSDKMESTDDDDSSRNDNIGTSSNSAIEL